MTDKQTPAIVPFSAKRQCCWCGNDNRNGVPGYAGERGCPTCGWGGNGERDVPCMFYKLVERADVKSP